MFVLLAGARGGFSEGDEHGGRLPQLHQIPHVCLQLPYLCEYFHVLPIHTLDIADTVWSGVDRPLKKKPECGHYGSCRKRSPAFQWKQPIIFYNTYSWFVSHFIHDWLRLLELKFNQQFQIFGWEVTYPILNIQNVVLYVLFNDWLYVSHFIIPSLEYLVTSIPCIQNRWTGVLPSDLSRYSFIKDALYLFI